MFFLRQMLTIGVVVIDGSTMNAVVVLCPVDIETLEKNNR
jgi:hypothetical protein